MYNNRVEYKKYFLRYQKLKNIFWLNLLRPQNGQILNLGFLKNLTQLAECPILFLEKSLYTSVCTHNSRIIDLEVQHLTPLLGLRQLFNKTKKQTTYGISASVTKMFGDKMVFCSGMATGRQFLGFKV